MADTAKESRGQDRRESIAVIGDTRARAAWGKTLADRPDRAFDAYVRERPDSRKAAASKLARFAPRDCLRFVHPGSEDTGPEWPAERSIHRQGAAREAWAALLRVAHSGSPARWATLA